VALAEPRWPLPEVPELEDRSWATVLAGPCRWRCDAARQVENFTDFGRFSWVHPGLLGDPGRPVVPRYAVRTEGHVLHYSIVRPDARNTDDFPVFANEQPGPPERRSPLRTAPAVHDRAAAGLGRGTGHGVPFRLPADRRRSTRSPSTYRKAMRALGLSASDQPVR